MELLSNIKKISNSTCLLVKKKNKQFPVKRKNLVERTKIIN